MRFRGPEALSDSGKDSPDRPSPTAGPQCVFLSMLNYLVPCERGGVPSKRELSFRGRPAT
jgi:hypothetical protein